MPTSGPKPTDLTKKKLPAKKTEEKTEPVVNGDSTPAEAQVENGVNGVNGHHHEGDEVIEAATLEA
jgi:hypothetical protein